MGAKAFRLLVLAVLFWSTSVGAQSRGEETSKSPTAVDSRTDIAAGEHASEAATSLRIGALAGVGFPRLVAFEGMVRLGDVVALGVEYGTSPTISISHVDVTITTITIAPLGLVAESATLDTYFVNPRIGLLWTLGPGITIGTEAGVQVPVSSNFATTVPAAVLALSPDADRAVRTLGGVLPTVDLLRVGVLF
jgi:hypothetical protein